MPELVIGNEQFLSNLVVVSKAKYRNDYDEEEEDDDY